MFDRSEARITAGAPWDVTIRVLRRWSGHGQHPTIGRGITPSPWSSVRRYWFPTSPSMTVPPPSPTSSPRVGRGSKPLRANRTSDLNHDHRVTRTHMPMRVRHYAACYQYADHRSRNDCTRTGRLRKTVYLRLRAQPSLFLRLSSHHQALVASGDPRA